jgi:predicted transcriptional regulator
MPLQIDCSAEAEQYQLTAITCSAGGPLSVAARLMWENDCGVLPVIDDGGRLVGMVTDRDICMAAFTQGTLLDAIETRTAMAPNVLACHPDDSVEAVEKLMKDGQVRRIPVIDDDHKPVGIVSLNDLARHAAEEGRTQVNREVVSTLATISEPRIAVRSGDSARPTPVRASGTMAEPDRPSTAH